MREIKCLYVLNNVSNPEKPRIISPGPHISMDFLGFEKPNGELIVEPELPGGSPTYTLESLAKYLIKRGLIDKFQLIAFACQGNRTPTGGNPPWADGRVKEFDRLGIGYIIYVYDVPMTSYTGLQPPYGPIMWILYDPENPNEPISFQKANEMIPSRLKEHEDLISRSLVIINAQPPSFSAEISRIAQQRDGVYTAMLIDAYPTYRDKDGRCPFERDIVDFVSGWHPHKGCILVDVNEREATAIKRFCEGRENEGPLTLEEIEESFYYFSRRKLPVLGTLGPFGNVLAYKDEMVATPSFFRSPYRGGVVSKLRSIESLLANLSLGHHIGRSAFRQMYHNIVNTCGCGDSGKGAVLGIFLEVALEMGWDPGSFRKLLDHLPLDEESFKIRCSVEANAESRLNLDRPCLFSNPPPSTILGISLKKGRTPVFHSIKDLISYMEEKYGLDKKLLLNPPPPRRITDMVSMHKEICVEIHQGFKAEDM